jgi:hypothetical protein
MARWGQGGSFTAIVVGVFTNARNGQLDVKYQYTFSYITPERVDLKY